MDIRLRTLCRDFFFGRTSRDYLSRLPRMTVETLVPNCTTRDTNLEAFDDDITFHRQGFEEQKCGVWLDWMSDSSFMVH
jgi:hypothetical protein